PGIKEVTEPLFELLAHAVSETGPPAEPYWWLPLSVPGSKLLTQNIRPNLQAGTVLSAVDDEPQRIDTTGHRDHGDKRGRTITVVQRLLGAAGQRSERIQQQRDPLAPD